MSRTKNARQASLTSAEEACLRANYQRKPKREAPWIALSLALGLAALGMLFRPFLHIRMEGCEIQSHIVQLVFQNFRLNGVLLAYPLLSRLTAALAVLALLSALVFVLWKRSLAAAFSALGASFFLIVAHVGLSPLHARIAAAFQRELGAGERAFTVGAPFLLALLFCLLFAAIQFIRYSAERFAERLFQLAACVSIGMVALITIYLIAIGLPPILEIGPAGFFFESSWQPTHKTDPRYGILNMILASLCSTGGAVLIGIPIGIFCAIFLAELAPPFLRNIVRPAVELLAGIPSVVYGFFAVQLIAPMVQRIFGLKSGANLLTTILVLAIMILPTLVMTVQTALESVPQTYKEASLSLGATPIRTIFKVCLPACRSSVLSGVVLGLGRAIGETMAIIMVAGGRANLPTLFGSVRPLTIGIVMEMSYATGLHERALFSIGLVLFVFIMLINWAFTYFAKKGVAIHEI